jgi:hypothetical protein
MQTMKLLMIQFSSNADTFFSTLFSDIINLCLDTICIMLMSDSAKLHFAVEWVALVLHIQVPDSDPGSLACSTHWSFS